MDKNMEHQVCHKTCIGARRSAGKPGNNLLTVGEGLCRLAKAQRYRGKKCAWRKLGNRGNDVALGTMSLKLHQGNEAGNAEHCRE